MKSPHPGHPVWTHAIHEAMRIANTAASAPGSKPTTATTSTTSTTPATPAAETAIEGLSDLQAQQSASPAAGAFQSSPSSSLSSSSSPSSSSSSPLTGDGLHKGMHGPQVHALQAALNAYGASPALATDGDFGPRTDRALRLLQNDLGLPVTGTLDAATLDAMGRRPPGGFEVLATTGLPAAGSKASALAQAAQQAAARRDTLGRCAGGVGDALEAIGVKVRVPSAYLYAEQLAGDARFHEVFVDRHELKDLPPGAVVVWGKSGNHPHGHVAITVGGGKEASDHVQAIRGGSYGGAWGGGVTTEQNFRVFVPDEEN